MDMPPYSSTPASRQRIREMPESEQPISRLLAHTPSHLSLAELIAIILNTPDALDLAHETIRGCGSDLARLSAADLQQLHGIGPTRAAQLVAAIELGRRVLQEPNEPRPQLKSPADVAELLLPHLSHKEQEHFLVLLLNTKNVLLHTCWLYQGSLNSSVVRVAEVFREAIRRQAAAIIIAHNHPSGEVDPSPEDVRVTRDIRMAGELLDVEVLDHLILGRQRYLSMKERGLGF